MVYGMLVYVTKVVVGNVDTSQFHVPSQEAAWQDFYFVMRHIEIR